MADSESVGELVKDNKGKSGNVHQCETCKKVFPLNCLLKRHMRTHTKETPYMCKTCGAKFTQSGSLRIHEKIHLDIKNFSCPSCPMAFRQKVNLMTHIKKVHPTDETIKSSKLACQYCESYFSSKINLSHHQILIHAGKQKDSLDNTISNVMADLMSMSQFTDTENKSDTPKVANYLENLKITTNDGIRLYHCSVCDYGFKKPSDLLRHSVVHSNAKPHQCPMCEKRYRLPTVLREHMKNHHSIKFKSNKNTVLQECVNAAKDQEDASEQVTNAAEELSQYQSNLSNITIEVNPTTVNYGLSMPLLSDTESLNSPFLIAQSNVDDKTTNVEQPALTTCPSEESGKCHMPENVSNQSQTLTDKGDKTHVTSSANLNCNDNSTLQQNDSTPQNANNITELFTNFLEESNQLNVSNEITDNTVVNTDQESLIPSISDCENMNPSLLFEIHLSQETEQSQLLTLESDKGKAVINVIDEFLIRKKQTTADEPTIIEISYDQNNIQNKVNDKTAINTTKEVILCDDKLVNLAIVDLPIGEDSILTSLDMKMNTDHSKYDEVQTVSINQLLETSLNHNLDKSTTNNNLSETEPSYLTSDLSEIDKQLHVDSYFNIIPRAEPSITVTDHSTAESTDLNILEAVAIGNDVLTTKNFIDDKCESENIVEQANMKQSDQQANELQVTDNEIPVDPALLIDTLLKPTSNKQQLINSQKTCEECSVTFKRHHDLVRHMRTHTREQPFQCSICGKPFSFKSAMKTHQLTHMNVKERPKFNCHVCGKSLSSKNCLKGHMRIHNNSKPYQCPICKLSFTFASNRKLHIVNYHLFKKGRKKSLKDMILDLDLTNVDNMGSQNKVNNVIQSETARNEQKQISKQKQRTKYRCDTCKKIFNQRSVILRHLLSHTDVKTHKCGTCNAAFKQASSLKLHEVTHQPPPFNKPHTCPYCPRRFTQKNNLKTHIKMHLRSTAIT